MEEKTAEIIQAIFIITALFVLIAAFVVLYLLYFNRRKARFHKEQEKLKEEFTNQLLQAQVEVQENTYSSLAKELHDNVGQLLSTSKMMLGLASRNLQQPPDSLVQADETIGVAIKELRALSKSLDREWLNQFSFIENLKTEIGRINTCDDVHAAYTRQDQIPLKSDAQIILFRIVQEALQNAIKHAKPKHIEIKSEQANNNLLISITDDGKGFDPSNSSGMGLRNMKHRTHLLGGTINWVSKPNGGTTINIKLPVKTD